LSIVLLAGCVPVANGQSVIAVTIQADDGEQTLSVPAGSTVQYAIDQAKVSLSSLDRVDPPTFSLLLENARITVTRVKEVFEIEEKTIEFETQTVRNESLPAGQKMLIQPGVNGVQQITYRRLLEDNVEVSRTVFKTTNLVEARPEIVMVGVQTPFTAVSIPGRLAYLAAGNGWIMEDTTGDRRPVVTTGDLDGRVFSLSPDGEWLLFTRKYSPTEGAINSLWVVNLTEEDPEPISLDVDNIIHYAGWIPESGLMVAYSSVEPRDTAPGWQANNDLHFLTLGSIGGVVRDQEILAASSGGIYGWWGTRFAFSPDGNQLAYARPDSIGLVDMENGQLMPILELIPLQTRSDWAWVPNLGWSPDGNILYTVSHVAMAGLTSDEVSPLFDLTILDPATGEGMDLIPQTGMFAYPVTSSRDASDRYQVAYLQSIFPDQSETSRYRLTIMDRDGSNRTIIFPPEGSPGLDPQEVVWGPSYSQNDWIALIYQGNLWLYNLQTDQSHQITGDGSIGRLDWK